ncbi:cysteine proteinase [Lentinula aff. detonsa]|uniref:ubiquitinyl hydrolase 1 n=1 Tax=Lentinula aff. detonsa TaxID=2804958 RepID=A0AA38KGV6_9AGAR|nr:cysteine proteinase [Lentinula aff. detonsa]
MAENTTSAPQILPETDASPSNPSSDPSTEEQNPPVEHATQITEDTDISTLSAAQVYELNQNLLDLTSDVQRPLIAEIAPIDELRAEYENGSPSFVQQINYLQSQGYSSIRRTRGDGDCFYRSVAFAYVENLLHASDPVFAVVAALSTLEATPKLLESVGFERMVFEDFYEVLIELVKNVIAPDVSGSTLTDVALLEKFQNPEESNSIVVYLRMLTSAQIRLDPDNFAPFLFHPELGEPMEIREFCEHFVDAAGKEADHVQMTALSRILRINVDVAYLDGRGSSGQVDFVKFQPEETSGAAASSPISLLYRPGHYDILVGPRRQTAEL